MPKLSGPQFDRLMSEYVQAQEFNQGGERFFAEMDARIYQPGTAFGDLPPRERFVLSLVAETAEEVLTEQKSL